MWVIIFSLTNRSEEYTSNSDTDRHNIYICTQLIADAWHIITTKIIRNITVKTVKDDMITTAAEEQDTTNKQLTSLNQITFLR